MSKKPIIAFEGIEGTGKSHHIKKIANYLTRKKIKFIKIREPGGSENSEKIRNLIPVSYTHLTLPTIYSV